jgi:hypothetical protein
MAAALLLSIWSQTLGGASVDAAAAHTRAGKNYIAACRGGSSEARRILKSAPHLLPDQGAPDRRRCGRVGWHSGGRAREVARGGGMSDLGVEPEIELELFLLPAGFLYFFATAGAGSPGRRSTRCGRPWRPCAIQGALARG